MHDKASTRPKRRHNCSGPKLLQPEWGNMRCSKCGSDNREGANFCNACGTALGNNCAACGALNQPGAKFCDECGAALTSGVTSKAEGVAPAVVPSAGERRHLTVLFCDLVGSTGIAARLDPE